MTDRRALPIVLILPVLLWLACWPFTQVGVNDDFGYTHIVRGILDTGWLHYNGWCSPILGIQAYYGALWAKVFGFSQDVLRWSTLPHAIAVAGMTYALHRRLTIPSAWAFFATLLLIASPLVIPWTASFMTDIPGMTFTLLLLHAIVSLTQTSNPRRVMLWTAVVVLIGILGGMVRQTHFFMAGAALLVELWHRRRERPMTPLIALAVALAILGAATLGLLYWYGTQPYATVDPRPAGRRVPWSIVHLTKLGLTWALWCFPLGIAMLRTRRVNLRWCAAAAIVALIGCLALQFVTPGTIWGGFGLGLWSQNTVTPTGLLQAEIDAPGMRPTVVPWAVRIAIAVAVYTLVAAIVLRLWNRRDALHREVQRLFRNDHVGIERAIVSILLVLSIYFLLLVPRAADGHTFDRYLLPPMVMAVGVALFVIRDRLEVSRPGVLAWSLLGVYALFGIAITRDHFAELRVRDQIAADLSAAGYQRTDITNGLTFDGWTQLSTQGHVNDYRIKTPAGTYRPDPNGEARKAIFWYLPFTPVVEPRLAVQNLPDAVPPADGRSVYSYRSILPPMRRWIVVTPVDQTVTVARESQGR